MNNIVKLDQPTNFISDAVATEQALLGAILLAPHTYIAASSTLKPEYFSDPINRMLFEAFIKSRESGLNGDVMEVMRVLGDKANDDIGNGCSVKKYAVHLAAETTTLNVMDYAKAVRDYWVLRQLQNVATISAQGGLPNVLINDVFDKIDEIRNERADLGCSSADVETLCMSVLERSSKIAGGLEKEPGLTTGIPELDKAILGFRPGELVIIAGRPGMGKSTVATSLALSASHTSKGARRGGVGFLGLELGENAIGARMLADVCSGENDSPSHSDIRAGHLTDRQQWMLEDARGCLRQRSLHIDYRSSATISDIESICRSWQRQFEKQGQRLDAIFIDYIKQVKTGDRYRGNRVYEIGEITSGLRDIGKRLQLCVVLLVQLNRGVEGRDDKRPMLSDLRESGDIENDADVVLMLYREAYYLKRELRSADAEKYSEIHNRLRLAENTLEIIITKNRNGEGEATVPAFCDIARSAIRPFIQGGHSYG